MKDFYIVTKQLNNLTFYLSKNPEKLHCFHKNIKQHENFQRFLSTESAIYLCKNYVIILLNYNLVFTLWLSPPTTSYTYHDSSASGCIRIMIAIKFGPNARQRPVIALVQCCIIAYQSEVYNVPCIDMSFKKLATLSQSVSLYLLQSVLLAVQFKFYSCSFPLWASFSSSFPSSPFLRFLSLSSQMWVYWSFGVSYIMYPLYPSQHVIDEFVLLLWTENASMLLQFNRTTTGNVTHKQQSGFRSKL